MPSALRRAASAPKISVGTYSGSTSNDSSSPPRLIPTVSAAPNVPITDSAGVPSNSDSTSPPYPAAGRFSSTASTGAATTSGTPVVSQCASALTLSAASSGNGAVARTSSVPSSKSSARMRSSDKRHASSAASHKTPAAIRPNRSDCGPTLKGTSTTTIRKNARPRPKPPPARNASRKSRINSALTKTPRRWRPVARPAPSHGRV